MSHVLLWAMVVALGGGAVIFWLALRKRGASPATVSGGADPAANERETHLQQAAQAIREILARITETVRRTDQAAGSSSQTLQQVRGTLSSAPVVPSLKDAQDALLREVDRMLQQNELLQQELSSARHELSEQKEKIESLQYAVRVDGLTELANRRHFDEYLLAALDQCKRYNEVFSLAMIDVDHFKSVNDRYGHQAGDRLLKGVARKLKASLRGSDFVARYGGEEFAAILIKAPLEKAIAAAEQVRESVEFSSYNLDGVDLRVTVSIGVAQARPDDTPKRIVDRADAALYGAKNGGRNRVCGSSSDE